MFKKKEKKEKSKKHKKQQQQKSVNKPTEKSSNTNPFMSLWNKRPTVFVPKTNQQVFTSDTCVRRGYASASLSA